jgi:hypothetical protein
MHDYYECERKFLLRWRLGLIRRGSIQSPALMVGTYMHEALQDLALGHTPAALATRMQGKVRDEITELEKLPGGCPAHVPLTLAKNLNMALAMALAFRALLITKGYGILDPGFTDVIQCEESIMIRVPSRVIAPVLRRGMDKKRRAKQMVISGTLDAITQDKPTGVVSLNDYKSTSRSPLLRAKTARFEPQVKIYRALSEVVLGDQKATEFRHYVIQKPTIRLKQKESFDEYLARVGQWYVDRSASHPHDPPVVVSRAALDGPIYDSSFVRMLREVHTACRIREPWAELYPQTGAPYACHNSFGSECPYLSLCTSDPVTWPDLIMTQFDQEFRYSDRSSVGE